MYRIILVVICLAFFSACSLKTREAPPEDVDKAAILFFQRLEQAQYEKIWDDAAESFKKTSQKTEVLESLKQMAGLGKAGTPARVEMTFTTDEGKRVALPKYAVRFEQNPASVLFKFVDESGEWKMGAFEVRQRAS
jgi:hypothetical protein